MHFLTWHLFVLSCSLLSSLPSLQSQIQPVLRAKDIKPCTAPRWRPLPRCGQQPEEEGSPAPKFQLWPRPQSASSQTQLWSRQGENPASRAQPSGSGDGERAGLLFPQGKQASLEFNKTLIHPHDGHIDACDNKTTNVMDACWLVPKKYSKFSAQS